MFLRLLLASAGARCAQAPEEPILIGPGVTPPKILRHLPPDYPTVGRKLGLDATVVLEITVDAGGRPISIVVLRTAGFSFDEKAVQAVEQWRFAPGTKG